MHSPLLSASSKAAAGPACQLVVLAAGQQFVQLLPAFPSLTQFGTG